MTEKEKDNFDIFENIYNIKEKNIKGISGEILKSLIYNNEILIIKIEPNYFKKYNSTIEEMEKGIELVKKSYFAQHTNINTYVKNLFDGYTINYNTINLFIKRVGNDLNSLSNEAEKIKIYKINDKIITDKDIIDCTHEKIDINIFKFIDNIINKNKKESITTYKEMLKVGEEPIKIIVMLANQFRLMYQVKVLVSKGYTEDDIASLLNSKKYPVHLAIQKGYRYSSDILLKHLEELADLDIKIKSGDIDKNLALELFLLRI